LNLYNSLTNKIEEFVPEGDEVTIYSCGPTLYKNGHIGNLVSAIYADTLRRTIDFAFPDKKVKQVMNFTDIDDKTVRESTNKYPKLPPMERLLKLTEAIEKEVIDDYVSVGIDVDKIEFVRATKHIVGMQVLIKKLLKEEVAYKAEDGIYFSIEKHKANGKKYGQLVEITAESTGAQRIDNDEYDKEQVHDFALWKTANKDEPAWDFEIDGKNFSGRPGWHIECSVMSTGYLGQPFDVHSGGVDLKFPHHENEIAQSTGAGPEAVMAKFFFHSEHLLIDNKKMAKSEDNFYQLKDLSDKGFDPLAFRLFVLQGHYQRQLNFSWKALEASQFRLNTLRNLVELRFQIEQTKKSSIEETFRPILNNMHTPELLAKLDIVEEQVESYIELVDQILGLQFSKIEDAPQEVYELIEKRRVARSKDDYKSSDKIRDELKKKGYNLKDSADKTYWQRQY